MRRIIAAVCCMGLVVFSAACVASAENARTVIAGTAEGSTVKGTAQLADTQMGLKVEVHVSDAPPGAHGIHIHQYGDCGEKGDAAGGHYNPKNVQHGLFTKDGPAAAHPGDLGNIEVDAQGEGTLSAVLPNVALSTGEAPVAGRAIVLHEKPDDFGQPTGNAGGRIGCGAIRITKD
jgi:Cu-Zn family superoxide dismutase